MKSYFDSVYEMFSFAEILFLVKQESPKLKAMRRNGHEAYLGTGEIKLDSVLVVFRDSLPDEDDPCEYDRAVLICEEYTNGVKGEATRLLAEYKEYLECLEGMR